MQYERVTFMTINHDRSYLPADIEWLSAQGYAEEDLYSLRFQYSFAEAKTSFEEANAFMHKVMASIAQKFVCCQYDKELEKTLRFNSEDWDLFFYCNSLYMTRHIASADDRDYTYFTLTFNKAHTRERRAEICDAVLSLLRGEYEDCHALNVFVQYDAVWQKDKLAEDAAACAEDLKKRSVRYQGYAGRIVTVAGGAYFMKKYAKSRGNKLSDLDVIRMWMGVSG